MQPGQQEQLLVDIVILEIASKTTEVTSEWHNRNPYEVVFNNADDYDYFEVDASDFTRDANIGISTKSPDPDVKLPVDYEIILGGWGGTAWFLLIIELGLIVKL